MKCVFVIEQPSTSLLYRHPRFQELLKVVRIYKTSFWMAKYGAPSPKRTVLWANSGAVRKFRTDKLSRKDLNRLPVRLARKNVDGRGYTGNKKELKASQHLDCKEGFLLHTTIHGSLWRVFQHIIDWIKELPIWIWGQVRQGFQEVEGRNHHPSRSEGHQSCDLSSRLIV